MLTAEVIKSILLLILGASSCADVLKSPYHQDHLNITDRIIIKENNGTFGIQYEFEVNKDVEFLYEFTNVTKLLQNRTARIVVETINANDSNPVLIVVRQKKDVMAWQHPLIVSTRMSGRAEYQNVSRTICPLKYYETTSSGKDEDEEETLLVTASTFSPSNVSVKLSAELVKDFYLNLSEEKNITVSPSEPTFYGYLYPDDIEAVFLTAHSEDEVCTTISVQSIDCPIYDLEDTIKFEGQWETMMYKGGMAIKRYENQTGFFVVFDVNSRDDECTGKQDTGHKNGNTIISFKLAPNLSKDEYLLPILLPLFLCPLPFVLYAAIIFCKHRIKCLPVQSNVNQNDSQEDLGRENQTHQKPSTSNEYRGASENSNNGVAMETISGNDAVRASRKKSHLYLWITILAGVFFFVPAVQRVFTYQLILHETGNYDLCYYNNHCAHPLDALNLSDFNHVYSNIGYFILGILFIIITCLEKKYYEKQLSGKKKQEFPHQFGLYYAMGVSLIAEGCLSAAYHVCPRGSNYQFDTTFMYVTALLCMVNIYQNHDEHNYANASSIFMFLGSVTFFVMLGNVFLIYFSNANFYFSIFIAFCQMLVSLLITLQLYYSGKISIKWTAVKEVFFKLKDGCCTCEKPSDGCKMGFLIFVNAINLVFAVLGAMGYFGGIADILLLVFIVNLLVPILYHIFTKHQMIRKRAENRNISEPGNRPEALMTSREVASDIAIGASSSQTIATESTDVNESESRQNLTDGMSTNAAQSIPENNFIAYLKIIFCKLWEPNLYFLLAALFWVPALCFFFSKTSSWEETPAMSRNKNEPCVFLNYYDNHDVWHFLSAGALFFSSMFFLTLNNHRLDAL